MAIVEKLGNANKLKEKGLSDRRPHLIVISMGHY